MSGDSDSEIEGISEGEIKSSSNDESRAAVATMAR